MAEQPTTRPRFPLTRRYPWTARVHVDLPWQLGGERRLFHVTGEKTLDFRATNNPRYAAFRIASQKLTLPATDLALGEKQGSLRSQPLRIPKLTIGPEAIDQEMNQGRLDIETGRFALQYRLRVTPEAAPVLANFNLPEVPLLVQESGQLELRPGGSYSSVFRFALPPDYQGPLRINCWGSKGCATEAGFCASLDGEPCQSPTTVYICRGEEVDLWWDCSSDVTSAEITPDIGVVARSGHITVRPSTTTEYTLTVSGECRRTVHITVHVVQEGDVLDMMAIYNFASHVWEYNMPDSICSRTIKITSIAPACGSNCMIHTPPILYYAYLDCGGTMCNGDWSVWKRDLDGHLHTFNTALMVIDVPDIPLAGSWQFTPLVPTEQPHGFAYFQLTMKC